MVERKAEISQTCRLNTCPPPVCTADQRLKVDRIDEIVTVYQGDISSIDLFMLGILNRLFNVNEGHILAIQHDHYIYATPLVRIQQDPPVYFPLQTTF